MANKSVKILVIGSAFVDMAVKCKEFPMPGQSVRGNGFSLAPMGAGLNQAISASLCGCETTFITKLGKDVFGQYLAECLDRYDVKTEYLEIANAINSGVSLTYVNDKGENMSCVSENANQCIQPEYLESARIERLFALSDVCVIDGQICQGAIDMSVKLAGMNGTKIVFSTPLQVEPGMGIFARLPKDCFSVDVFVPYFMDSMIGDEVTAGNIRLLKSTGSDYMERGFKSVAINTPRRGCFSFDMNGCEQLEDYAGDFVDWSGATDSFIGAIAACIGVGDPLAKTVKFAAASASIASKSFGAIETIPTKEKVLELLMRKND